MKQRLGIGVIVGVGALVWIGMWAPGCRRNQNPSQSEPSPPLNVLIVTFDALRADALGYAGKPLPTSPRLDELASHSAVFTQAVSSFLGTTASMPSLMTGLWPSFEGISQWNGDTWNGFWDLKSPGERGKNGLTDNVTTLAERFRDAGWSTAGFNTNPYLGTAYNFDQGFDHYDQFLSYLNEIRTHRTHDLEPSYPPAEIVIRSVNRWFDNHSGKPFFVWLHLMDPHSPYMPPGPYARMFPGPYSAASDLDINKSLYEMLFARRGDPKAETYPSPQALGLTTRAAVDHARGLYLDEVRYADYYLGALLDRLKSDGTLDHTLLVVTADHGEEFLDHGHIFHELIQPAYEELIRIPLLIRFPDRTGAGRRVDRPVRMVDVAPTVLDAAGLHDYTLDGRTLMPFLTGTDAGDRTAFLSAPDFGIVRTAKWKLRFWRDEARPAELYNIADDPSETTDLAGLHPVELQAMLHRWDRFSATLATRATSAATPAVGTPPVDRLTREQLEALGYTTE